VSRSATLFRARRAATYLLALGLLAVPTLPASGQVHALVEAHSPCPSLGPMNGGPEDTPADSSWVTERVFGISFCGIALDSSSKIEARAIIKRAFLTYFIYRRGDPDREKKIVALADRRDSLLLRFVHTAQDSNKYIEQSVYFRSPRPASRHLVP
jgi:hypothetical protein